MLTVIIITAVFYKLDLL